MHIFVHKRLIWFEDYKFLLYDRIKPAEKVVVSVPSVGRSHGWRGAGVVNGVRGKLSSGASGCRMSYRNSGIMGTKY